MKQIQLTQGYAALVDDADYEEVSRHKWYYSGGYAYRTERRDGKKIYIAMHRVIARTPDGMATDHRNHVTLDNRSQNLRVCTTTLNHANKKKRGGLTSKYKGVCWCKRDGKWVSRIKKDGLPRIVIGNGKKAKTYDRNGNIIPQPFNDGFSN